MPDVKETQTAVPVEDAQAPAPAPAAPPRPPAKPKGKGKKKMIKRLIALAVLAAIVGGAGFGMWYLVFREDSTLGEPLTDMAQINTIQSMQCFALLHQYNVCALEYFHVEYNFWYFENYLNP